VREEKPLGGRGDSLERDVQQKSCLPWHGNLGGEWEG
jgi:hypothetical protein